MSIEVHRKLRLVPIERKQPQRPLLAQASPAPIRAQAHHRLHRKEDAAMATAVALPGHEVIGIVPPGELVELGIVQAVPIVERAVVRHAPDVQGRPRLPGRRDRGPFRGVPRLLRLRRWRVPRHGRCRAGVPLPRGGQVARLGQGPPVAAGAPDRWIDGAATAPTIKEAHTG